MRDASQVAFILHSSLRYEGEAPDAGDWVRSRVVVDALSSTLGEMASFSYDYEQFLPDNGGESTASNDRPWRILADGLQNRYTAADDHFTADIALQYPKSLTTAAVSVLSITAPLDPSSHAHTAR